VLIFLASIANFLLADRYILPKKTIKDDIISYRNVNYTKTSKFGRNNIFIGYEFYTQKGFEFSTDKTFVQENKILIEYTPIFKNITGIKTENEDYSNRLISGLNSVNLYFYIILAISSTISLLILLFNKEITDNGFQNIVLFNLMMLFFISILYIYI
jgi:hypothetical protein